MVFRENESRDLSGIVAIWKPAGWTSHDVVARLRRLTRTKRIGHTGTLDPYVTGVLPVCIGRATRVVEYVQDVPKTYEVTLLLGVSTDTEDATGTVLERVDSVSVTEEQVRNVLASFVGDIMQVPPMYSAVSVDGQRLYNLARQGKVVERPSRRVHIYSLELLHLEESDRPRIRFRVRCSKGTYVRTLCVDIGRALGVPASMAELVRTESGGFVRADCVTLEQVQLMMDAGTFAAHLLPADRALRTYPRAVVDANTAENLWDGHKINPARLQSYSEQNVEPGKLFTIYREDEVFVGIFSYDEQLGRVIGVKVFTPEQRMAKGGSSKSDETDSFTRSSK